MAAASQEDDLCLAFRKGGNAAPYCVTGWSDPEETETWCVGASSTLVLPAPQSTRAHILLLQLRPHVQAGGLAAQRLRVRVNGIAVAAFSLPGTVSGRVSRGCVIPAAALAARSVMEIVFETPDAARPSAFGPNRDSRELAVAVSSLRLYEDRLATTAILADAGPAIGPTTGPADGAATPLPQLMLNFESLGQNCEFGLVQRQGDAEPLGLLRFASSPLPNLLAALECEFAGMGTAETVQVEISPNGREFMIRDLCYGLSYHAWVKTGQMTAEELHRRETRRVPILVRKLLEELHLGEKIFVFRGMGVLPEEVVFALAASLRRYGPNTLLFVSLSDPLHPGGTVERRAAGFLVGYLDRFAPGENAHDFLFDQWVQVCRGALRHHPCRVAYAAERASA